MNTQQVEVMTERIKALEDNSHMLERRLVAAVQTIQRLRHDISVGRIERLRSNQSAAAIAVANILDERDIVVPKELAVIPSRIKKGNKRSGARNRTHEIVSKRWGLWKIQHEQGYTTHQIARAWKCCRTSVEYARNKNFVAGGK
ncbi:MAG: hypothetical protein EBR82_88305 [Caulobacteraceae bacterium]|nr:hypothetical protein [Caulobacteraceae bacterium]